MWKTIALPSGNPSSKQWISNVPLIIIERKWTYIIRVGSPCSAIDLARWHWCASLQQHPCNVMDGLNQANQVELRRLDLLCYVALS